MLPDIAGYEPIVALCLVAALFLAFVLEKYPPEVPAIAAAAVFILLGFIETPDVMAVFSNSAPITIAVMFVVSGALVRTGVLEALAGAIVAMAAKHPLAAIAGFLLAAIAVSAFINNTPLVVILIPVVIRLAAAAGVASTRLLIPLSYAAILGGTCSLIGTSTNLLVDGVARGNGLAGFGIFEIAPVGIAAALAGTAFMVGFGRFLLPNRQRAERGRDESAFLSEVVFKEGAGAIGRKIADIAEVNRSGIRILGLRREGRILRANLPEETLGAGDALVIQASTSELLTLNELKEAKLGRGNRAPGDNMIAEAIVGATGRHVGERIASLPLGGRFGLRVLGANRHNHLPGPDLGEVRLRPADRLLLEGPDTGFDALADEASLIALSHPSGRAYRRQRAPVAVLALASVVGLAAWGVMDIAVLGMLAVAVLLLVRCVDADEAWSAIDGSILILIFAMLIVGKGLDNTGAVKLMVDTIMPLIEDLPPIVLLAAVYALASFLTEVVTNNAVAVIVTPIVIALAEQAGLDPRGLVVAVMMGASASFATPIGYQTNTLVYGAADYRFADFLKIGVPMNIIVGIAAVLAISVFFPL